MTTNLKLISSAPLGKIAKARLAFANSREREQLLAKNKHVFRQLEHCKCQQYSCPSWQPVSLLVKMADFEGLL